MATWYESWAFHHCEMFGRKGEDKFVAAFLAWEDALTGAMAATELELLEVTRRMQLDTPTPNFINEHFDAIKKHLADVKRQARRHDQTDDERSSCVLCAGNGLVTVPHPKYVVLDEWQPASFNHQNDPIRLTAAVYCTCYHGQWLFTNACVNAENKQRTKPLDLKGYQEKVTPHWKRLLDEEDSRRAVLGEAREIGANIQAILQGVARHPRS